MAVPTLQELGIDRLSDKDKKRLAIEIWESIPPTDDLSVPGWTPEDLDRRIAMSQHDPDIRSMWQDIKARMFKQQ